MDEKMEADSVRVTTLEPALLSATDMATFCRMSRSAFYKQLAAGRIIAPIRIGKITRWRRAEVQLWLEAGAPARQRWEAMSHEKN